MFLFQSKLIKLCFVFLIILNTRSFSDEKPFVIIIPSYNNKNLYKKNLDSVMFQNYSNYRIIYIDDNSPDGTGNLVKQYIKEKNKNNLVNLICNDTRKKAFANLYKAIHSCDDNEIIVTVDGDDFLKDNDVLKYLNAMYSNFNIWLTYGQFELLSNKKSGHSKKYPDNIIEQNGFRDYGFCASHLRTFYAWLFKLIKLEDLIYFDSFFPMAWDLAMMLPMLEMAGHRHKFISKILYVYNDLNILSDYKTDLNLQRKLTKLILSKTKYQVLNK